ncbi:MAG: hypothetical protein GC182_08695 [Rhodopseudomonas sp.]|nr:hypothetical protein [Rhodopseudomonas sp.]
MAMPYRTTPPFIPARALPPIPASLGFVVRPSVVRLPIGWIVLALAWAMFAATVVIVERIAA